MTAAPDTFALQVRAALPADAPSLGTLLGRPVALPPTDEEMLLVACDDGGALLGTLRLRAAIGLGLPRASYHVGCTVHAAAELRIFHRQRTLLLGNDHTGAGELADIAWQRDGLALSAQAAVLRLLVASALAWMGKTRHRHAGAVVCELPGPRDSAGQAPFWQGLGRHFFQGDPVQAALQHGPAWRSHVAALLPRQAVYTAFLPASAEAAIAQVDPPARVLREVLEEAGLRYGHHVNVDDGGPILEAVTDELPALRQGRAWSLAAGEVAPGAPAWLVLAEPAASPWRAVRLRAQAEGGRLVVRSADAAQLLLPTPGASPVWAVPLSA